MAANSGKFIDRLPIICAAGKATDNSGNSVYNTLQEYSIADQNAIENVREKKEFIPPRNLPPIQNAAHCGLYSEIRHIMQPPVKTRYETLINDLRETTYRSYWNQPVGRRKDEIPGLPKGMDAVNTVFGTPTKRDITAKELISPPKSHYEVLWESQLGHGLYKVTHNDYNPSEQINRGYKSPAFDPDKCFGRKTNYDPRGIGARCACNWFEKEPVVYGNNILADYKEKSEHKIGKALTPCENIKCVPENHRFGKATTQDTYGVQDLLRDPDCKPCFEKRDFYKWLSELNILRNHIKMRRKRGLNLDDLRRRFQFYDKAHTNCIRLSDFYHICECNRITFNRQYMELLLQKLKILSNDVVNYRKFVEIIDVNGNFEAIKFDDVPKENQRYLTTSQSNSCDYFLINNAELPPAGLPSIRTDLLHSIVPPGGCRADLANLGDETSSGALLNPNIYTNYGLSYRDFYQGRSAEEMRSLCEKVGYTFPGNSFSDLWQVGMERDQTGELVCLETFKRILRQCELAAPPILVDELDCI